MLRYLIAASVAALPVSFLLGLAFGLSGPEDKTLAGTAFFTAIGFPLALFYISIFGAPAFFFASSFWTITGPRAAIGGVAVFVIPFGLIWLPTILRGETGFIDAFQLESAIGLSLALTGAALGGYVFWRVWTHLEHKAIIDNVENAHHE